MANVRMLQFGEDMLKDAGNVHTSVGLSEDCTDTCVTLWEAGAGQPEDEVRLFHTGADKWTGLLVQTHLDMTVPEAKALLLQLQEALLR